VSLGNALGGGGETRVGLGGGGGGVLLWLSKTLWGEPISKHGKEIQAGNEGG